MFLHIDYAQVVAFLSGWPALTCHRDSQPYRQKFWCYLGDEGWEEEAGSQPSYSYQRRRTGDGKGSAGWHCPLRGSHLLQLLKMQSISAHC